MASMSKAVLDAVALMRKRRGREKETKRKRKRAGKEEEVGVDIHAVCDSRTPAHPRALACTQHRKQKEVQRTLQ